jgi:hypothetical protein
MAEDGKVVDEMASETDALSIPAEVEVTAESRSV